MAVRDNFLTSLYSGVGGWTEPPLLFKVGGRRDQFDWLSPGMSCTPVERTWLQMGFK